MSRKVKDKQSRRRPRLEEIEPRILYSADFAPGLVDAATSVPAAEQRILEPTGEFTQAAIEDAQSRRHEIVFVDVAVPDYQRFIDGIRAQGGERDIEVVVLDAAEDGLKQISQTLAQRSDLSAVHLISHGSDGAVQLGSSTLDFDTLLANAAEIKGWGKAFAADGDLLIYGCDVAQHQDGKSLIDALARLTGADVAASEDTTGAASQGGDWALEYQYGLVQTQLVFNQPMFADWSGTLQAIASGVETRANATTSGIQDATVNGLPRAVATDANGNFVVVWASNTAGQDGSGYGIYARRYNAAGVAQGGEFRVNNTTAGDQYQPTVAMDASGDFVVAWVSNGQDGSAFGVYAQRFNASGAQVGGEFRVNSTTFSDQFTPIVAMNASGNFVVAWTSFGQDGSGYGIFAQRYNASGVAQGGELPINTSTAGDQWPDGLVMDAAGNFIATYASSDVSGWGVYAVRYDLGLNMVGAEVRVNTTTAGDQDNSTVAMDSSGNYVVAWRSTDGAGTGIYAQRHNSSGTKIGGEFLVNTTTAGDQTRPQVAMDSGGRFVVVWSSFNQDAAGTWGVYQQEYHANGTTNGGEVRVSGTTSGNQQNASISMTAQGDYVVAWSGEGTGDADGVFFQRYINSGVTVTPTSGLTTTEAGGTATFSVVLDRAPTSNVTISLTSSDTTEGTISAGSLTFTTGNWSVAQTVTVTGVDDAFGDGSIGYTIVTGATVSADPNYSGLAVADVSVTNSDTTPSEPARTFNEDGSQVFSAAGGNAVNVTDGTTADGTLRVQLTVTNGIFTLSQTTGLTFISGANGSSTMIVQGLESNINAALNGSVYTPTANYNGSASLQVTTTRVPDVTAQYTFENSGSLGADSTGTYNGTVGGSGTTGVVDPVHGNVVSMTGSGYIQTTGRFGNPASVTLGAWVNLTAADAGGADVISLGDSVALRLDDVVGGVTGFMYNGTAWQNTRSSQFVAGTGWHYVAYTFDNVSKAATLYLDGTVVASATLTGSITYNQGANSQIGRHGNGGTTHDFNGRIEDVRVYNRALTAAEITALATDAKGPTQSVAITVNAVNDAPTRTAASVSLAAVAEDTANPAGATVSSLFTSAFTDVTDQVSGGSSANTLAGVAVTANAANGGAEGRWQWYNGSAWVDISTSVSDSSALVLASGTSVRFLPNADFSGTPGTLTVRLIDNSAGAATSGTTVNVTTSGGTTRYSDSSNAVTLTTSVTAVNDAPVLANTVLSLNAVNEDAGAPSGAVGTLVSALVGGVSDVDSGAVQGIAITAADASNGTWWYSTNNGSSWSALGTPSGVSSRLLASDANSRIYFQPNANYAGTLATAVTFRAWDQTSGTNGSTANTGSNGGTTAFSGAIDTASLTVTAVNDAPTITNAATVALTGTNEDTTSSGTTVNTILTGASWADVDSGASKGIAVTAVTGSGTWQYSTDGSTWTAFGSVSGSAALLLDSASQVRYVPNGQNGETATFSFKAWDQATGSASTNGSPSTANPGAGGGSSAYSSQSASASIVVTSVNDAPVLDNSGAMSLTGINEDATANGGDLVSAIIASAGGDRITDVDSGAVEGIAVTALVSGNGTWQYSTDGGGSWNAVGAVSNNSALLLRAVDRLRFVPDGLNADSPSLSFRAWDQSSGTQGTKVDVSSNGGSTAFSSAIETASLTVTAVNDAPVLADTVVTLNAVNEDAGAPVGAVGTLISALTGGISDVDSGALEGIAITAADTANGSWWYSTDNGASWNALGSPSGASSRLLAADAGTRIAFQPNANYNGTLATAITFRAWDQSSGANGGVANTTTNGGTTAFSSATDTASLTVNPLNDAPTGVPTISGTVTEDQTLTANTGGIADVDGLGAFGYQWLRNGVAIGGATAGTYTLGDADVGTQISVRVSYTDGQGTAESVTSAQTAAVANVNDVPAGVPTISGTVTEDQTLTANTAGISDADGLGGFSYQWLRNGVAIGGAIAGTYTLGDADVGTQISVRVTYTDAHGTSEGPLTSAQTAPVANVNDVPVGVPTISGTVTEDQTLTANTGGIADADGLGAFGYQWLRNGVAIGGATAGTYTLGDADVGTQISVRVSYTDGHGTAESVTSAQTAGVANVNDAPVGIPTISGTVTEDQILTASTAGISDADGLGAFGYQWLRNGVAIGGATAGTYTLGDADVGTQISVRVTYTDAHGTSEGPLTSAQTAPVANVNDVPAGIPTISGTVTEDQTLTANTGGISDADGLGAFGYQWLRNGVAIGGATAGTYALGDADVGTQISVRVSYTDGHGTAESVTSAQTAAVANVNDAPVGIPTISGTVTEDQILTANTAGISDADGLGAFGYQWLRNGVAIGGATAGTYTLGDADVGTQISVRVSYTDGQGTAESVTSAQTAAVANVNDVPAGVPTISGTVTEDQTLTANTAGISDADGLGAFSYQWLRNGVAIGGATAGTYTLGDADVGTQISVRVTYTDAHGTSEGPLTSAQTAPVANVNDAPTGVPTITGTVAEDQTLTANTGAIGDADGLGAFSYQWLRDGVAIGGATAGTYTLGDADVGTQISVQVSYTDGHGSAESVTSAQTAAVANVNDAPTGIPTISGTVTEDQTLTVNTAGIADADGLGAFGYQWLRDGVAIGGATSGTYTLGDADVGTQISVQVSYTDAHGTSEGPLTSAQTAAVANVNDAPVGVPTITGTVTEDQTLTASTAGIADADGLGAFSYQWLRNGVAIGGATAGTYALGDADVGTQISVQVSYTDGHGTAESVTSAQTAAVANVNDAPAGLPTISGTVIEDQALTANTGGIADADGLGAFGYQWLRNGVAIGGATAGTYTLGDADVGTQISVRVSYTDGHGTAESITSAQTAAVANVNDAPTGLPTITGTVTEDQTLTANTGGIADADGLGAFSYQWLRDGVAIGGATAGTYTLGDADVGTQISVQVSYTDTHGTSEGPLTSAQTAPVANINDVPVGVPTISGTVTEDQTFTANTGGIADADGLGAFGYQWLRNGVAIGGAIAGTYTLGDADVGTQISVRVSYTDGQGTAESVTSAQTAAVTNINDMPAGVPTISGTVTEDQTLIANTAGISDADGLGAFSYQWLRNGVAIGGATAGTYTLGDADVGTQISVRVTYTDAHGTSEGPLTSAQTAPVANVNDVPAGIPTISGTVTEDQTLTANTGGISDADGLGAFGYQWLRNGVAIGGATAGTYALGDADVGTQISVRVSYTDGHGTAESVTSAQTAAVANVNDAPVGIPTISGTVTEDQILTANTAGISDADGLGAFGYQWLRNGVAIGGATAGTYTLGDADVGTQISVRVSYTDGQGTAESVTSAQTAAVANVNDVPAGVPTISGTVTEDQTLTANTAGISDADGLGAFSYQWLRNGVAIGGATAGTYTLGDADVGTQISVRVTYTDAHGTSEGPLTSAQTAPVANVNDVPVGVPTISGTVTEDQTLTANTGGIADADGLGAFGYQWLRNGAAIGGATSGTYTLGDSDVGTQISVRVSYTDGQGTAESVTSAQTAAVANVNDAPVGIPTISGTVTEDQILTASTAGISDADGLGAFGYQWLRDGVAIGGATSGTYTLGDADVGTQISVQVSYTDAHGTSEGPLTSAQTAPVVNVNDAPVGVPTITGTVTEDQTLTASTAGIADADGLGAFGYQWLRNGAAIAGATAGTYTLGDADVGTQISVRVSYTDGHGTTESVTSAQTAAVANVNDAPTGVPTISGTVTEDQTLTANTGGIADVDGLGAFGYQWLRNGVAIGGAIAGTYTLGDADVGTQISVRVSYTDTQGTAESVTSAQTAAVANVNDVPAGVPTISGTVTEDQTLTASTAGISDADGLGAFSYQWLRDGVAIGGATAGTYVLGDADVGTQISVQVSYTDAHGTSEGPLTSAQTAPVANVNDVPSGVPTITGTVTEDQTLTANTGGIADTDGLGAFSYQWLRNGAAIGGATSGTYTLGDADVGTQISVQVSYTDGHGTAESVTSAQTAAVTNINDVPVGVPTISGTATEDQTLTANTGAIADADGLGAFSYQWLRNGMAIGGATSGTYTLGDADVGTQISVQVSYTDGHGTAESITSAQTVAVANVNDAPTGVPAITGTVAEDQTLTASTGGIADDDGLGAFSYQWLRNGAAIAGATSGTYILGDADVGTQISVQVSYTDGHGTSEGPLTSAQTAAVANVNDVPVGVPTITGTVTEDQTLTANTGGIADADGLGAFGYQWLRDGVAIGGATAGTYTLGDADVGTQISVQVSYTDAHGTAESVTSAQSAAVTNVNDVPTGIPTISGTVTEDQTLTANTAGIADADGLGAFSYQWLRNGAAIAGATAGTYTLGDADVGTQISVQVSYTDAHGTGEGPLTSAQTAPVTNVNDVPTGVPTITGTVSEDQTLTANTGGIGDADGLGAFSYQWMRNGVAIGGATAGTYTLGDADVGTQISVRVTYTDAHGTSEGPLTSAQTAPVVNVNDAPTGLPTITGTVTEDQTLTADIVGISDADGLGAFSYQWLRDGAAIGGATAGTYTLGDADVGTQISVQVTYTDAHGTSEGPLTSAQTAPVANVNDAPTGVPTITGTVSEDQTLTANTGGIADADGLGAFSYQWLRNGVAIGGATAGTYTLGDADVGTQISVQVSYTDGHGTAESLTSAQTAAVTNVNDVPAGVPTISGTVTEDQTLTANTAGISDADGLGAFSYQWLRNGVAIGGATAGTYTLGDADVGTQISVRVSYTDGHGTAESTTSAQTAAVANVNDVPVGVPAVTGTVTEDQTLTANTAGIADADGLGAFGYQWLRDGVAIGGATGGTYTLGDADVGTQISVQVSYIDVHGTAESVSSAQTAAVANINDAPVGVPAITGTVTEDQTLTADISAIADADGLGALSYQWLRNGVAIGGATAGTYTLGDADVGTQISVQVSYTDGHGSTESVTSAPTAAVANINDAPTGVPTITGTVTEDQTLTANTGGIADADGLGAFGYQWLRDGVAIGGANASTYTLGDADAGAVIEVDVSYIDGQGAAESLTSAGVGPVVNVNDAPTGLVTIAGIATEDQILTADTSGLADADGLGAFSYQWLRDGVAVAGATGSTYTLGDADVGGLIQLSVSYTDGQGGPESLTSLSVGPVANVNDAPVLTANSLSIGQGDRLVLSAANLSASDVDDPPGSLTFTVSNLSGGHFELAGAPGVAIAGFTQADLASGLVVFVHDGSAAGPAYAVTVSDGTLSDGPELAGISFNSNPVVIVPAAPPPLPVVGTASPEAEPQPEREAPAAARARVTPAVYSPGRIDPPDAQPNEFEFQALDTRRLLRPVATLNHFAAGPRIDPTLELLAALPANLQYLSSVPVDWSIRSAFPEAEDTERDRIDVLLEQVQVGGMALSVGVVWWASRISGLLGSLLASAPAWRHIDPLPVVGRDEDEDKKWYDPNARDVDADELAIDDVFEGAHTARGEQQA